MFSKVSEASITKAIVNDFSKWFNEYVISDVIVVGAGPSGLIAARELAKSGYKTLLVEANNYLGGGFWIGGYLMNTLTFRHPAQKILTELGVKYQEAEADLYTASGPEACSKLISSTCDAGVKILNMTKVDDVVYRDKTVQGVVINWTPIKALPRAITCVDPVSIEAKIVIDATGHDAFVCNYLEKRGLIETAEYGMMDADSSEDLIVEKTGQIYPGLVVAGMAVSTAYGVPRMGPTFAGMLFSGLKAAEETKKILQD